MKITRRNFLQGTLASAVVPVSFSLSGCVGEAQIFQHGVASGDPLADRVILWTRVTIPETYQNIAPEVITVQWQIAVDQGFTQIIQQGSTEALSSKDYTVKVDADGLLADTRYYYRFILENKISPVGRTKTLPATSIDQVKLAFTSCSHYSFGYFNVYARMADQDDLDVVLHLGDYLYEYGNDDIYRNPFLLNRLHEPAHEMLTLADYRQRHALYKTDIDLQRLHQTHPMICIWDDHEFANDAWQSGAENHQPDTEGSWQTRSQAAIQAYYEWMPIREPEMGQSREKAYRNFRFGDLLNLTMLDTRFIGRDQQISTFDGSENNPERTLLGFEQETWLEQQLLSAQQVGITWKLLGQQVMMMPMRLAGSYLNKDTWDGYQAARLRLLDFIESQQINDVVVLTGDIHSSWAAELAKNPYDINQYNALTAKGALAVEFVTSSVTSPSIPLVGVQQIVGDAAQLLRVENWHIKYIDMKNRGFVKLTITHQQVKADWYHVPIVSTRNNFVQKARTFIVKQGKAQLLSSR